MSGLGAAPRAGVGAAHRRSCSTRARAYEFCDVPARRVGSGSTGASGRSVTQLLQLAIEALERGAELARLAPLARRHVRSSFGARGARVAARSVVAAHARVHRRRANGSSVCSVSSSAAAAVLRCSAVRARRARCDRVSPLRLPRFIRGPKGTGFAARPPAVLSASLDSGLRSGRPSCSRAAADRLATEAAMLSRADGFALRRRRTRSSRTSGREYLPLAGRGLSRAHARTLRRENGVLPSSAILAKASVHTTCQASNVSIPLSSTAVERDSGRMRATSAASFSSKPSRLGDLARRPRQAHVDSPLRRASRDTRSSSKNVRTPMCTSGTTSCGYSRMPVRCLDRHRLRSGMRSNRPPESPIRAPRAPLGIDLRLDRMPDAHGVLAEGDLLVFGQRLDDAASRSRRTAPRSAAASRPTSQQCLRFAEIFDEHDLGPCGKRTLARPARSRRRRRR